MLPSLCQGTPEAAPNSQGDVPVNSCWSLMLIQKPRDRGIRILCPVSVGGFGYAPSQQLVDPNHCGTWKNVVAKGCHFCDLPQMIQDEKMRDKVKIIKFNIWGIEGKTQGNFLYHSFFNLNFIFQLQFTFNIIWY